MGVRRDRDGVRYVFFSFRGMKQCSVFGCGVTLGGHAWQRNSDIEGGDTPVKDLPTPGSGCTRQRSRGTRAQRARATLVGSAQGRIEEACGVNKAFENLPPQHSIIPPHLYR